METLNNNLTELQKLKQLVSTQEKTYKVECQCCGNIEVIMRRDLNFKLCTFLMSLKEMIENTGEKYHNYSDVIQYGRKRFKANVTDYSMLQNKFMLIEPLEGKGNQKYKTLSPAGELFLSNELAVSINFYSKKNGLTAYSKTRIKFETLVEDTIEDDKEDNAPFHMTVKDQMIGKERVEQLIAKKTFKSFL